MEDNNYSNNQGHEQRNIELPIKNKRKKRNKGLVIFLSIVIGLVILVIGINAMFHNEDTLSSQKYIGTIYVEGTISSGETNSFGLPIGYQHQWTLDKIEDLIHDENNKGLIVFVNSPGGGVYESDELYLKLKEYKEKTKNPVYSVMGSMAASGGYYISAATDKIIANRNTWTGSIGVTIGTMYDLSDFLKRYGVKWTTITAGKNKAMGSMVEPLTDEQKAIFQSLVDDAYAQFVGIVSQERKIDIEQTKKIADGRIYTAKQALDLKLVDDIGTLADAIHDMKKQYKLGDCDVIDIIYEDNSFWGSIMSSKMVNGLLGMKNLGGGDLTAIMNLVKDQQMPVSYLCESLVKK